MAGWPNPYRIKYYAPYLRPIDPPTSAIDDSPVICIPLNVEWIPYLLGLLEVFRWPDTWKSNQDWATQEFERLILQVSDATTCVELEHGTLLRQKPNDPCILEQSQDGGTTWTTAFDFSLCVRPADILDYEDYIDRLLNQYDGTAGSISSDVVYDGSSDDYDRDRALCHALGLLVNLVCEIGITYHEDTAALLDNVGNSLALLGAVAAVVAIPSGGTSLAVYVAACAALGGAASTLGASLYDAISVAQLEDMTAREDVHCCMYNAMKGSTPERADFQTAIDGCSLTGNAALIGNLVKEHIQDLNVYLTFVRSMEQSLRYQRFGLLEACACDNWTQVYEFAEYDSTGWTVLQGNWLGGGNTCLYSTVEPSGIAVIVEKSFTAFDGLETITLYNVGINPVAPTNQYIRWQIDHDGGTHTHDQAATGELGDVVYAVPALSGVTRIQITVREDNTGPDGTTRLCGVELSGQGTAP